MKLIPRRPLEFLDSQTKGFGIRVAYWFDTHFEATHECFMGHEIYFRAYSDGTLFFCIEGGFSGRSMRCLQDDKISPLRSASPTLFASGSKGIRGIWKNKNLTLNMLTRATYKIHKNIFYNIHRITYHDNIYIHFYKGTVQTFNFWTSWPDVCQCPVV